MFTLYHNFNTVNTMTSLLNIIFKYSILLFLKLPQWGITSLLFYSTWNTVELCHWCVNHSSTVLPLDSSRFCFWWLLWALIWNKSEHISGVLIHCFSPARLLLANADVALCWILCRTHFRIENRKLLGNLPAGDGQVLRGKNKNIWVTHPTSYLPNGLKKVRS